MDKYGKAQKECMPPQNTTSSLLICKQFTKEGKKLELNLADANEIKAKLVATSRC